MKEKTINRIEDFGSALLVGSIAVLAVSIGLAFFATAYSISPLGSIAAVILGLLIAKAV